MAIITEINPEYPEPHRLRSVLFTLRKGGLVLFPTDSVYAVGCIARDHEALARLHHFKPSASLKPQTMLCPSLSCAARFAEIDDEAFRLMRMLTPGPYTFILRGTKEVPKVVLNPKRRTAGLRIPDSKILLALLTELDDLMISTTAKLPTQGGEEVEPTGAHELFDAFDPLVDVIIDDGLPLSREHTTVIDLTASQPEIIREGLGMAAIAPFVLA